MAIAPRYRSQGGGSPGPVAPYQQAPAASPMAGIAEGAQVLSDALGRVQQRDDFLVAAKTSEGFQTQLQRTLSGFEGRDLADPRVRQEAADALDALQQETLTTGLNSLVTPDMKARFEAQIMQMSGAALRNVNRASLEKGISDTLNIIKQGGGALTQTAVTNPGALLDSASAYLAQSENAAALAGVAPDAARQAAGEQIGMAFQQSARALGRTVDGVQQARKLLDTAMADPKLAAALPPQVVGRLQGDLAFAELDYAATERKTNQIISVLTANNVDRATAARIAVGAPPPTDFQASVAWFRQGGMNQSEAVRNAGALFRAQTVQGTERERLRADLSAVLSMPEGWTPDPVTRAVQASKLAQLTRQVNPLTDRAVYTPDQLADAAAARLGYQFTADGRLVDISGQGAPAPVPTAAAPGVTAVPAPSVVGLDPSTMQGLALPPEVQQQMRAMPPGVSGRDTGINTTITNLIRTASLGQISNPESQVGQAEITHLRNVVVDALRPLGSERDSEAAFRRVADSVNLEPSLFQSPRELTQRFVSLRGRLVQQAAYLSNELASPSRVTSAAQRTELSEALTRTTRALSTPPFNAPIVGSNASLAEIKQTLDALPDGSVFISMPSGGQPIMRPVTPELRADLAARMKKLGGASAE